jgi:hypothetical protein
LFFLNLFFSFIIFLYIPLSFFTVEPGKAIIFETFGKPRKIYKEAGCHCDTVVCGRELKEVNIAI